VFILKIKTFYALHRRFFVSNVIELKHHNNIKEAVVRKIKNSENFFKKRQTVY